MNDLPANAAAANNQGGILPILETKVLPAAVSEREALSHSERRYRTLFEAMDSGFCILEMIFDNEGRAVDYRFLEANSAFERQSGLVDAVGHRIREFAPNLEEHWFERYGGVALSGEPMRVEGEVAPLGRWFDINAFRVGAPEQRHVAVLFQDITDRKHAEAALRTSEDQVEALLHQAPLGVYLVDANFLIRQVNPVALPAFGDIPGGPIGRDFAHVMHLLWHKTYADEVVSIFRHTLETGESYVTPERAEYRADRLRIEYYEWRLDRIRLSSGQYGVVCYFRDISAQVQARKEIEEGRENARRREEHQSFLLKLSDALRDELNAEAVANRAVQTLFEQMRLDRCCIGIYRLEEDRGEFPYQVHGGGLPPLPAHVCLSDFPKALEIASDRTLVINDVAEMDGLSDADRANLNALGHRALITATVRKGKNNPLWALVASSKHPRAWTESEVSLVEEVAERTWAAIERARAEEALRESESRLRALFASVDQGFMEVDVTMSADGRAVDWRYVALNPSFERLTGMEDVTGRLASEVFPDREPEWAERYAQVVTTGEPMRFELPAAAIGRWFDINLVNIGGAGSCRIAVVYDDVTERKRAVDLQRTLIDELQHRVRNILAMIQSVVRRTADTSESPEEFARHLGGRISAMARTQAILTRNPGREVDLQEIVQDELLSVAAREGQYWCEGPQVMLAPKAAEILTLAVHELATNAVKYGALSCSGGQLEVRWIVAKREEKDWLIFEWEECRISMTPMVREGFGSELIKRRVPYELRGKGSLEMGESGIRAKIEFPLSPRSSVLETGLPGKLQ